MVAHQRFEARLAFDAPPQTFPVLLVVIVCHGFTPAPLDAARQPPHAETTTHD
jgi:hypothetical protein